MKTNYTLSAKAAAELPTFAPVEGTWNTQHEDWYDAQEDIAADVSLKFGYPVKVQLFQSSGHAIGDECSEGNLLVTRK